MICTKSSVHSEPIFANSILKLYRDLADHSVNGQVNMYAHFFLDHQFLPFFIGRLLQYLLEMESNRHLNITFINTNWNTNKKKSANYPT